MSLVTIDGALNITGGQMVLATVSSLSSFAPGQGPVVTLVNGKMKLRVQ
jgi:hypothetical protein